MARYYGSGSCWLDVFNGSGCFLIRLADLDAEYRVLLDQATVSHCCLIIVKDTAASAESQALYVKHLFVKHASSSRLTLFRTVAIC